MKNTFILVITSSRSKQPGNSWSEREPAVKFFCSELEDRLDNSRVLYTTYSDLLFTVDNNTQSIYDVRNGCNLADADFVHFKNWQYDTATAPVVANFLLSKGIAFANTEVTHVAAIGKLAQMFELVANNIPIPATFSVSIKRLKQMVQADHVGTLTYPFIFKADDGAKGEDNYLVHSKSEFEEILEAIDENQEFILQEFVPNDGDYRYLFMGLESTPLVFLRKGSGESHLNNTSKGGEGIFQPIKGEVAKNLKTAKKAAEVTKRQVGGVDIIINRNTQQAYVLEVNGTPAIATGFGKHEKLDAFAAYISDRIDGQEEE